MAARLTAYVVVGIVAATLIAGLIVGAQRGDTDGPIDVIVHNAKVYTAGASGTMAEAVAIRGNQILRVGSEREVMRLRRPQTTMIDAKGAAVRAGIQRRPSAFHQRRPEPRTDRSRRRGNARRHPVPDPDMGGRPCGCSLGARAGVVLPAISRRPANPAAARCHRPRSTGPDHQLRRTHIVGEHAGAAAGTHHAEDAEPAPGA